MRIVDFSALGSGTRRMVKDCRAYGLSEPIWKEGSGHLVLEFLGLGIGEGVSEGVNAELRKIIVLVDATPGIMNAKQLATAIGKGHSTIERYLKILRVDISE